MSLAPARAYPYVPALAAGTAVASVVAAASLALWLRAGGVGLWLAFVAVAVGWTSAARVGEGWWIPPFPAPPDDVEVRVGRPRAVVGAVGWQMVAGALGLFAVAVAGLAVVGVGGGLSLAVAGARAVRQVRAREAAAGGRIVRYTRRASDGGRVPGYAVIVAGRPGVSAVPGSGASRP